MSKRQKPSTKEYPYNDIKTIMLSEISKRTLEFIIEYPKYDALISSNDLPSNINKCLNEFIEKEDIAPIRDLVSSVLNDTDNDDAKNLLLTYVNLQLAEKLIEFQDYHLALLYYQKGMFHDIHQRENKNYYEIEQSKRNSKKAQKQWKGHNQETERLKEKYLKIMRDGKHHTITSASEYIFAHDNPERKKYRWIYNKLSDAVNDK